MSRTITIVGGTDEVGKTNICLNLALQLSKLGNKTCIFDADLGSKSVKSLLQLHPENDLMDAIFKGMDLRDIIIEDPEGIDILPGGAGVDEMANFEVDQMGRQIQSFSKIALYDFLLIDTTGGISKNVVSFCLASSEVIIVIVPKPEAMIKAFNLLRVLSTNGFDGDAKVVVNRCNSSAVAKQAFKKFQNAIKKRLGMVVSPLGLIFEDERVDDAVALNKAFLSIYPTSDVSRCIRGIAQRLLKNRPGHLESFDFFAFWKGCIELINSPLDTNVNGMAKPRFPDTEPEYQAHKSPTQEEVVDEPERECPTIVLEGNEETGEDSFFKGRDPGGWYKNKDGSRLWNRATVSEAGETRDVIDVETALVPTVEKLIDNISVLSEEVKMLRKAINGKKNLSFQVDVSRGLSPGNSGEETDSSE